MAAYRFCFCDGATTVDPNYNDYGSNGTDGASSRRKRWRDGVDDLRRPDRGRWTRMNRAGVNHEIEPFGIQSTRLNLDKDFEMLRRYLV